MANWSFYLDGNQVEEPIGWDGIEFTALRMESHGIDQPFSTEVRFYGKGAKYIKNVFDVYFINQPIAIQIVSDVGYNGQPYQFDGFLNLSIYEEYNVCDTDSWEITVGIMDDDFREQFKARQDIEIDLITTKDLNGQTIDPVSFDEIRLHKQELYLVGEGRNLASQFSYLKFVPQGGGIDRNWTYPDYVNVVPCFWGNSDFKDIFGSDFDTQGSAFANDNVIFVNNATYTRSLDFNIKIVGTFTWDTNPPDGWFFDGETADIDFYIRTMDEFGTNDTFYLIGTTAINTGSLTAPTVTSFDIQATINNVVVNPNYRVLVLAYWGTGGNIKREVPILVSNYGDKQRWLYMGISEVCIKMSEKNSGEYASTTKGMYIEDFLKRMIYIITGENDKLLTDVFSVDNGGCYWNNFLTNGLKIRNAPTIDQIVQGCTDDVEPNTSIKVTWKKVFDNLDKIFCLGWAYEWTGTEWKIRLEPREYFYQNSISQTFNNVGEVKQLAMADKLVNNIQIGYNDKWKNISISGAWAIHTDRNYFIGNRAMNEGSSSRLDLLSDIICEGYAIEYSRRLSFIEYDSGSSDQRNDYEIFLIWLNRYSIEIEDVEDTCYAIPDETGTITFSPGTISLSSNLINFSSSPLQNLYNIFHTPARVAGRWWKVLGMHTYGLTYRNLRYQVGQYQTTYSSCINDSTEPCIQFDTDATVYEDMDIGLDTLDPEESYILFKPITVEFTYPQSLCDFLTLSQDEQYRKVRLTSGSLDLQGFILEATNKPEDASGGTTQFKVLVSAIDALEGGAFTQGFDTGYDNG